MSGMRVTAVLLVCFYLALGVLPGVAQIQKGVRITLPAAKYPDNSPRRLFYVDSVYAAFPDTVAIGIAYRPMVGDVQPAYLKGGVAKSVEQCLFTHYPGLSPSHRPVRLRIDRLTYIEDPTQGYELEAELQFFQQDSARRYVPFYKATIETGMSGLGRGGTIAEQLVKSFERMNDYLNEPAKYPNYQDDHEAAMHQAAIFMKLDTARYTADLAAEDNVLTCKQRREGIYLNEEDLIRNRPALVGALALEPRREVVSLLRPDKRRSRYRFLGFCSGGELYINAGRYGGNNAQYMRVLDIGPYLLWRDNYVTAEERNTNAAAVGAGGLLGGLIAAAATNYRDCIAIDTRTGNMLNVTPQLLKTILADSPALLAEYQAAEKPRKSDTIYEFMRRYNQAQRPEGNR